MTPDEIEKYIFLKNLLRNSSNFDLSVDFIEAVVVELDDFHYTVGGRVIAEYEELHGAKGACY